MKLRLGAAVCAIVGALLAGCASHNQAPVVTRTLGAPPPINTGPVTAAVPAAGGRPAAAPGDGFYTVKRGDTLYGIALDHGVSYRDLADWNNISNPNAIRADQVLRVRPPGEAAGDQGGVQVRPLAEAAQPQVRALGEAGQPPSQPPAAGAQPSRAPDNQPQLPMTSGLVKAEPRALKLPYSEENLAAVSQPRPAAVAATPFAPPAAPAATVASAARPADIKPAPVPAPPIQAPEGDDDDVDWGWPTAGHVSAPFSESSNKGVDIAGRDGQPIVASASGTVLYVGSGIRGYGKLIVIRHNKAYSTVYAHNSAILVKEGQHVVKGQKVAEMGNTDSDQVKLHFEIRKLGKPVDPTKLLPAT
jgi:lipoprotein NlpD